MDILRVKDNDQWVGIPAIRGERGPKGDKGNTGSIGPQGPKGDKGDTGETGPQGLKGDTGSIGPQGPKGDKGDTGETGSQGPKGDTGTTGEQGPKGDTGDSGVYYGSETPTDPDVNVWVDPNGNAYNPIDDTSASATDKAWSAAKTTEELKKKAPVIINSASGNPVVINDGIPGLKLYDVKVSFAPKQEGSGDPSPTNIRPITGWDGVNIHRLGKNLVQFNSQQGPSATFYNGYSGWLTNGSWRIPDMSIKYTYSAYIDNRNASASSCAKIWFYGADGATSAGITEGTQIAAGAEGWSVVSFGNNANLYFAAFGLGLQAGGVATQGMVEIGESRTDYETYSDTTIPISWQSEAGTVYGGTVDALTGVLTVTHKFIDLTNISSNLWTKSTSYPGGFYCNIQTGSLGIKAQTDFICSHAKTAHIISNYEYGTCYCDGSVNIRIMQSGSKLTDWQTYLSEQSQNGTPVCICAELAESYAVQLDPVTLSMLIGTNTIWTDADTAEIAYPVDTKKYVDAGARDVQVNGISVLNNGVANIPAAGSGTYGVVKIGSWLYGISLMPNGTLYVSTADSTVIKQGTVGYRGIAPQYQHESVFYGLSKVAGVDLASQTVTPGQYPESAKIAIQKMLGIYEPDYELIYSATLAQRTCLDVAVDQYGEPFNLRSVFMEMYYPANLETESSGYGRYYFLDSNGVGVEAEFGRYITAANSSFKQADVTKKGNRTICNYTRQATTGGQGSWQIKNMLSSGQNALGVRFDMGNIVRIQMNPNDFEPAGTIIQIWGQRAY